MIALRCGQDRAGPRQETENDDGACGVVGVDVGFAAHGCVGVEVEIPHVLLLLRLGAFDEAHRCEQAQGPTRLGVLVDGAVAVLELLVAGGGVACVVEGGAVVAGTVKDVAVLSTFSRVYVDKHVGGSC